MHDKDGKERNGNLTHEGFSRLLHDVKLYDYNNLTKRERQKMNSKMTASTKKRLLW